MKRIVQTLIITACLGSAAPMAFGQGAVGFANNPTARIIDGQTGAPAASSAGYTVGLYWSTDAAGEYRLGATTPIGNIAGIFNNGGSPAIIDGADVGASVFVIVRAWTGGHDSYEAALLDSAAFVGSSNPTSALTLVQPGGTSPAQNLVVNGGLQGFTTTAVPEPSTIAFGIMGGIGALMLMRRRK